MFIKNLQQATQLLKEFVPIVSQVTGKDMTLQRVEPLFEALGDPQKKLKVIHVAGTSGKTSTSYYIAALLHAMGKKLGLTVSPHIDSVTERIQINGVPVSDELFCTYLGECLEAIQSLKETPSYFELLMAMAFYVFEKEGVDYAVIETGMGGLHDASNIADNPDKLCVITDIGFDHMHILGNTIPEIAAQKAGIIHAGNTVLMYKQGHEVMTEIRKQCEAVGAQYVTIEAHTLPQSNMPDFQKRNFALALASVNEIMKRESLPVLSDKDIAIAMNTYIPARMDTVRIGGKTIIMDGAHNGQKMKQFVDSFMAQYPKQKVAVVLALKDGKEYKEVMKLLLPIAAKYIFTSFNVTQDIPSQSMDASVLAGEADRYGCAYVIEPDQLKAVEIASEASDIVLVTGSFYLIAQLRDALKVQHVYSTN